MSRTVLLGDVCEFRNGFAFKSNSFLPQGMPVLRISNIQQDTISNRKLVYVNPRSYKESLDKYLVMPGDLLIAMSGATTGKIAINNTKDKYYLNQRVGKFIPSRKLDKIFLYYLLKTKVEENLNISKGSAQPNLSTEQIKSIIVPDLDIQEQRRIVKKLNEAFEKIDKAIELTQKNLQNSKDLFISFSQHTFAKLQKTKPEKKLGEVADIIGGHSFKSTDFKKHGKYQVIRMGNVRPGIIREAEKPVYIDSLEKKILKKSLLLRNDVIITQTGTKNKRDYGFTAIIDSDNYLVNQRISAIRFSENYLPKFFLYFSWTNFFKDQYFANESGTVGQGNVGIGAITQAKVPFLPIEKQKLIVKKLDKNYKQKQKLQKLYQQKLDNLQELKKSLLDKAFKGEL